MTFIRHFGSGAVRSKDRDRRTDARRLARLGDAVATALSGVTVDISGLARRNELLRGWAGDLMGTADCSGVEREDEAQLLDAEQQLLAGSRRLAQLEASRSFLASLQNAIEAHVERATTVSAGAYSTIGR